MVEGWRSPPRSCRFALAGDGRVQWRVMASPPERPDGAPPSALPPLAARILAFSAVVVAGLLGGLIGYGVVDLSCDGGCTLAAGGVGLGGALLCAGGVAIVAVLTLRAMGEWRSGGRRRDRGIT